LLLAQQPPKIPARVFFSNPQRSAYAISPNGKMLSFLRPWKSHLNIFVQEIPSKNLFRLTAEQTDDVETLHEQDAQFGRARRLTAEQMRDVPDYFWKGNRYIIFRQDDHGDENYHLYRVDLKNSNRRSGPEDLTPFPNVCAELIDPLQGISATDILIKLNQRDSKIFDACRLNVVNGKIDIVVENHYGAQDWVTNHAGSIRAGIAQNGTETSLLTRADDKSDFRTVLTTDFRHRVFPLAYTFDDKALYATSNIGRDKAALVTIDPETGRELNVIYEHQEVDVFTADFSKKQQTLTYVVFSTSQMERHFFDTKTENLFKTLDREFPGHLIWLTAHDELERKFIVEVASDRTPGTRYLFDRRTGTFTKLTEMAPLLSEKDAAPMKPINYASADGWTIHGYLTLPPGRGTTRLPAVIYPHGGPWQRDNWGYDPEVQFLANRGYAVLQMNFRGSVGYGREFWEAGFKEWGGKMQDDVTAGVKWLIDRGTADPKRIAIYGESYGGYAALAGVTFTPKLYAAAIDRAGISNLVDFLTQLPGYWDSLLPELYAKVGNPKENEQMLAGRSPFLHADQIKAPLFISHGRKDVRVNISQSEQMIAALKEHGLNPEYLWFDDEGHIFKTEAARVRFHKKLADFLGKHLH
jgi:dipeptidyl aminopeptidase/acylaminoacyl peptidase